MVDIGLMNFRAHLQLLGKTRAVNTIRGSAKAEPRELFWNSNTLFIFVCDTPFTRAQNPSELCVRVCEDIPEHYKDNVHNSAKFAKVPG